MKPARTFILKMVPKKVIYFTRTQLTTNINRWKVKFFYAFFYAFARSLCQTGFEVKEANPMIHTKEGA